jgi:Putative restriction endonuclease
MVATTQKPPSIESADIDKSDIDKPDKPKVKPAKVKAPKPKITWQTLPDNYVLPDEPVESIAQPLVAGALSESLELVDYVQPDMLIASNMGICATVDEKVAVKAPDWFCAKVTNPIVDAANRRSYTPSLEGESPQVVMEFLSATDGQEYSVKSTFPCGKWYFYEQVLRVPIYVIFTPSNGELEVYCLLESKYELQPKDENQRYWLEEMGLYLGSWQGTKEGRTGYWLRWWDSQGNLLSWALERLEQERQLAEQERHKAEQERQKAEREQQRAEQESQKAERLREQLRMLGIAPND